MQRRSSCSVNWRDHAFSHPPGGSGVVVEVVIVLGVTVVLVVGAGVDVSVGVDLGVGVDVGGTPSAQS